MIQLAWMDWGTEGITFGLTDERVCVYPDCRTRLSRSNDGVRCGIHESPLNIREAW